MLKIRPSSPAVGLGLAVALLVGCKRQQADKPAGLPGSGVTATESPGPATPPPAAVPPSAPPSAAAVADDEIAPGAPDPATTVSGTITLPAARKKNVSSGDVIFIVARRAGGPPGPGSMLAVQKHPVGDFPMPFTLSGRDAMIPGTPFEGMVNVTVRLDKDGDAMTRRKGDLFGQANNVKVGAQDVVIPLDSVQTEDHTLGGGMTAPGAGLPPGHP
jgi:hypothetical protein